MSARNTHYVESLIMRNRIKKHLSQLTYKDLSNINKSLGSPIRNCILQWIYTQLHNIENKRSISVKAPSITNEEYQYLFILDNVLSKDFYLPDSEIKHY